MATSRRTQLKIVLTKNWWLKKQRLPVTITLLNSILSFIIFSKISTPVPNGTVSDLVMAPAFLDCLTRTNNTCFLGVAPADDYQNQPNSSFPQWAGLIQQEILRSSAPLVIGNISIPPLLMPFANESAMEAAFANSTVWGGVVFRRGALPEEIAYDIRFPNFFLPGPYRNQTNDVFSGGIVRIFYSGAMLWANAGFSALQRIVDAALLTWQSARSPNGFSGQPFFNFTVNPMPNPTYLLPNLWIQANSNLQQAFIGPIIILALDLVRERRSRLREYLRIHGLKESMYWLSWLITVFISMMVLVGFVWAIPAAIGMFKQDPWWPFIILLMYGFSCISFGVWASTMSATPQMAGVLVILFTWIIGGFSLYFVNAGYGVQTAISLLSPIAFQFAMTEHTRQEMLAIGVAPQEVDGFGQFSRSTSVIMMAVDTVLYLLLAWWVSNVFPGEAGVPKPWYFMFTRSYWCPKRHSADEIVDDEIEIDPKLAKNFEPLDSAKNLAVKIRKLRKEFAGPSPTDPNFVAVDSLDLDIEKNTVFALLGQNGAGKSTTISMLTGLLGATSGDAFINGSSVRSEMDKVRDSLGICPQHDILIEDLSVEQHLEIFARLKGVPEGEATRRAVAQALDDVELTEKRDNKANELSGGMKRRLSLALALIGDSSVIFLDEPTSGLDPVNRRGVWDLVKKNRQGRTFILTTHFMQEADILGDRICIMAHGKMRCCGTSEFLKRQLGRGYYLSVVTRKEGLDKKALKFIQENAPDAEIIQSHGSDITFLLPFDAVSQFPTLFSRVEEDTQRDDKRQIFVNYGVSMTTLEDVFLEIIRVADDEKAAEGGDDKKKSKKKEEPKTDGKIEMDQFGNDERDKIINPNSHKPAGGFQQFKALLKAKFTASIRSWPSLVSFLLIPAIFAALMLAATLVTVGRVNPDPVLLGGGNQTADLSRVVFNRTLLGSSVISYACLTNTSSDCQLTGQNDFPLPSNAGANNVSFAYSSTEADFNRSLILGVRGKEYFTGGSLVFSRLNFQSRSAIFRIHTRKEASESVPVLTNLVSNTLIQNMTSDPNVRPSITTASKPFPSFPLSLRIPTSIPSIAVGLGSNVDQQFLIGLVFALSIVGAIVVREIVYDKQYHLYLQLEMMGCSPLVYWLVNIIVDYCKLWLSFVPVYLVVLAFQAEWLLGWRFGPFILFSSVMLFAFLLFQYVLSKLFNNADDSIKFILICNLAFAAIPYIVILVLQIVQLVQGLDSTKKDAIFYVSSYITIFNPLTLFTAAIHEQQILATDKGVADLFVWDAQGLRLFFLFIHIIVHSGILIFTNKGRDPTAIKHFAPPKPRPPVIRPNMNPELAEKLKRQYELATKEPEYDPDVVDEKQRLLGKENNAADEEAPAASESSANGSLLKSVGLYKYYNSDIPAVRPMYVGVEGRSCFGLLGTNGAGKSTLIGMILGQLSPSGGKVDINQVPVYSTPRTQMYEASLLGACLQDDALWPTLTPREHIDLFLRMRNDLSQYTDRQLAALTQNILAQLRLSSHQNKLSEQLSGGNKRKLCSAIALLCGNKVVLLDEPSTGMDPSMRRALWTVISREREANDLCVLLTTHSMEEAEAICTKIGIMVKGQLKALGSNQHLKSRFGEGYSLRIDAETVEDVPKIQKFIESTFPKSSVLEEYGRHLSYDVGVLESPASAFASIEKSKKKLSIANYSLSQTTLEQVFLRFASEDVEKKDADV